MKQFVVKCFVVIGIVFVANWVITQFASPFYGNERLDKKLVYLEEHAEQYNTLFLGSSRVNNQVNPIIFDKTSGTKSFNMGIGGCNGIETMKLVEYLLNHSDRYDIKDIIVEFPNSQLPKSDNSTSVRGNYFADRQSINQSIQSASKGTSTVKKYINHSMYYKALLNKSLGLGYLNSKIKSYFTLPYEIKNNMIEGHFPLIGKATNAKAKIVGNRSVDKTYLDDLKKKTVKVYQKKSYPNTKKAWATRLIEIEKLAKSLDIGITYILYPKVESNYYFNALGILKANPKLKFIDLARPGENPKFYDLEYSYDKAHLNSEGAEILTKKMAKLFKRKQ